MGLLSRADPPEQFQGGLRAWQMREGDHVARMRPSDEMGKVRYLGCEEPLLRLRRSKRYVNPAVWSPIVSLRCISRQKNVDLAVAVLSCGSHKAELPRLTLTAVPFFHQLKHYMYRPSQFVKLTQLRGVDSRIDPIIPRRGKKMWGSRVSGQEESTRFVF